MKLVFIRAIFYHMMSLLGSLHNYSSIPKLCCLTPVMRFQIAAVKKCIHLAKLKMSISGKVKNVHIWQSEKMYISGKVKNCTYLAK